MQSREHLMRRGNGRSTTAVSYRAAVGYVITDEYCSHFACLPDSSIKKSLKMDIPLGLTSDCTIGPDSKTIEIFS